MQSPEASMRACGGRGGVPTDALQPAAAGTWQHVLVFATRTGRRRAGLVAHKNGNRTIDDVDLLCGVARGQRRVAGDHDELVRRGREHLERGLAVLLQRRLEDREARKAEVRLDLQPQ
jgi:hypothetical protein